LQGQGKLCKVKRISRRNTYSAARQNEGWVEGRYIIERRKIKVATVQQNKYHFNDSVERQMEIQQEKDRVVELTETKKFKALKKVQSLLLK